MNSFHSLFMIILLYLNNMLHNVIVFFSLLLTLSIETIK